MGTSTHLKNIRSSLRLTAWPIVLFVALVLSSCAGQPASEKPASNMAAAREAKKVRKELRDMRELIAPFFEPMGEPSSSDWLASHNEPGQTFEEYLDADPKRPDKDHQTIYVLPLGSFSDRDRKLVDTAAGYLEVFYDLPVVTLPNKEFKAVWPNVRVNRFTGTRQIKTGYILDEVLKPLLPRDAAALIAFVFDDLYPDDTMNYVFGQASLEDRVGVWSLARLDDNATYAQFLRRTLKIAAHETGHMFSMRHCTKYECLMSGTNHLQETDRHPIDACPECTAKICWLSNADPAERYRRLAEFCRKNDLRQEAAEFEKKAAAVAAVN